MNRPAGWGARPGYDRGERNPAAEPGISLGHVLDVVRSFGVSVDEAREAFGALFDAVDGAPPVPCPYIGGPDS